MRLGCQTITWGEGQHERFDAIFAATAAAGYAGVEIGIRHLQRAGDDAGVRALLEAHGVTLAASHVGGNLDDPGQAAAERSVLDDALRRLNAFGCPLLLYSGLRYSDDARFEVDLDRLNRADLRCREHGVTLLYHNHDWEFADDGRVISALLDRTALRLCPDVGWIAKAGVDVIPLLNRVGERVVAIHFKDFASSGKGVDTVILGEGIAPLREVAVWMRRHLPADAWAIAEQDLSSDRPPTDAIGKNAAYMTEIRTEILK